MGRGVVLGAQAVGALGLAVGGAPLGAPATSAVGWALAAGVFLMLMLRGRGLTVMAVVVVLLALAAAVGAALAGGWAWVLLLPAAVLLWGAVGVVRGTGRPAAVAGEGPRAALPDDWRRFDQGQDPTAVAGPEEPR